MNIKGILKILLIADMIFVCLMNVIVKLKKNILVCLNKYMILNGWFNYFKMKLLSVKA
jgi:hypothetical protein